MGLDRLTLEVIRNAAIYTSEEMGVVLRDTAFSPNIRDRLDHSCAVLSPRGELVAQAEHIPVHIGSMAVGVRAAVRALEREGLSLEPGDVVVTNDPYIAGTHLNDVLALMPVYHGGEMVAIVANKAHHVDVGGAVPGSIGGARDLVGEGLVVPPVKLVERGRLRGDILRLLKANVRTPEYLEGDLRAQLASLRVGERRLRELAERYGAEALLEAWEWILGYSERYARRRIAESGARGSYEAVDYLELSGGGEAVVRVKLSFTGDGGVVADYTGSSPQVPEPLNAVYGVTVAATTYALKAVFDPEMPVNEGFFRAVRIEAPEGSIVNPRPPAPVGAGNTETSQRIADVVLQALAKALPGRVPASSCGTMTNLLLGGYAPGRGSWAFYETIACGQGARPGLDGVDGVQTNMTNTLNTPVEVLENEYPVMVVEYQLRPDSGGPGEWRGGLGVTRAIKLLEGEATLTIVSDRCRHRPPGLAGGKPGAPSMHILERAGGGRERLPCKTTVRMGAGDTVYINTPGGGGLGDPCRRRRELVERDIEDGKVSPEAAAREYCYQPGGARRA